MHEQVKVGNTDFRKQMGHQCSLCDNDLSLGHFSLSSRSFRYEVMTEKICASYWTVVFYMAGWIPNKEQLRTALIFFHLKKTVAESYQWPRQAGERAR